MMRRALELAERGRGFTHPNPLVGAVVVRDGRIAGEGWHERFGGAHAEINAIREAGGEAACRGAEIHVTLEPCSHHGKTPPCVDAILRSGFARVSFAIEDPNPEVGGRGRAALERAGVAVRCGTLAAEAEDLNRAYLRFRRAGLPFVTWKTAETLDGLLTLEPGRRTPITGPETRAEVLRLRSLHDAVAIGVETAIIDDPSLRGLEGARDPLRVVFDTRARLPLASRLVAENPERTIVVAGSGAPGDRVAGLRRAGVRVLEIPVAADASGRVRLDLRESLAAIARLGPLDILLESGRTLGEAMIGAGLIQRRIIFRAPIREGRRIAPEDHPLSRDPRAIRFGDDFMLESVQD